IRAWWPIDTIEPSSTTNSVPGLMGMPRSTSRRNLVVLKHFAIPAACNTFLAACAEVRPITLPPPASHALAPAAAVCVLPAPAGPTPTGTRRGGGGPSADQGCPWRGRPDVRLGAA